MEFICFDNEPGRVYSDIVKVDGKYLFLSGLVSENLKTGELLDGDITFQTRTVLENLQAILTEYGSDMEHVIPVEVLLKNFAERDEMNAEYVKHFDAAHLPARLCFGDVRLAAGLKIEIMATAVMKK